MEKKKTTQRNKITYKMAILFSGEPHTLCIQTIEFRINNGHLLCSYYSQLKENFLKISVFQNYLYFENLFAFLNNNSLTKRARLTSTIQAHNFQDF